MRFWNPSTLLFGLLLLLLGSTHLSAKLTVATDEQPLDSSAQLFGMTTSCVGEQLTTIPLDFTVTGFLFAGSATITSIEFYRTDTALVQGESRFRLTRDAGGRAMPMIDYVLTESAPTTSSSGLSSMRTPRTITGTTRFYLSFNPQRVGPHFGRMIIRTTATDVRGHDTDGVMKPGIIEINLIGRADGAVLASNLTGTGLKPVDMGSVRVGQTVRRWVRVVNAGYCVMWINRPSFEVVGGDVSEFRVEQLSLGFIGSTNDLSYALMPRSVDSMLISFTPRQVGSRRASIYLRTNDSSLGGSGVQRGTYVLDLNGDGAGGLYASLLANAADFYGGVIGDTVGPFPHNVVHLTNNGTAPVTIISLKIADGDSLDFRKMTGSTWPTTPFVLQPGATVDIPIEFRPLSGAATLRSSCLEIETADGETLDAILTGTAGTRSVAASPMMISYPTARVGMVMRRTVTITNSGSLPLRITQPSLGGVNPDQFLLGSMPRLELAPGQTEFLEVTYRPNAAGSASATISIGTNASTGPIIIVLNGMANAARFSDDDPNATAINDGRVDRIGPTTGMGLVSGVTAPSSGLSLTGVVPNPATTNATLHFTHAPGTSASLLLVDTRGAAVWSGRSDPAATAERVVHIPVADLAAGTYLLRVTVGSTMLVRSIIVAH